MIAENSEYKKTDIYILGLLFPFMHPRGFSEYFSEYKIFCTIWLYSVVLIIALMFIFKIARGYTKYKKCVPFILLYFLTFLIITFYVQGGITQGIQKVVVTPILCVYCMMAIKTKLVQHIRCLASIMIVNFVLNATLFSPWVFPEYFDADKHIIFLGHVQIASQLGILGIFIGYLCRELSMRMIGNLLMCLSVVTMIISDTAASKIAIVLFFVFLIISKTYVFRFIMYLDSQYYIYLWLVLNICMYVFYKLLNGKYIILGIDFTLSGRIFVWKEIIAAVKESFIYGYGAYGVLIKVFWHKWQDQSGMNYAHNELLQRMLDGGIILLVLFIIMMYYFVRNMKHVKNSKMKTVANMCLIIILINRKY